VCGGGDGERKEGGRGAVCVSCEALASLPGAPLVVRCALAGISSFPSESENSPSHEQRYPRERGGPPTFVCGRGASPITNTNPTPGLCHLVRGKSMVLPEFQPCVLSALSLYTCSYHESMSTSCMSSWSGTPTATQGGNGRAGRKGAEALQENELDSSSTTAAAVASRHCCWDTGEEPR